jgi:RNA polymerase sigma factor (TIGR02999 family)
MAAPAREDPTVILERACAGNEAGAAKLIGVVYDELREVASRFLGKEQAGHTLQPTALVHEAYLKLIDQRRVSWRGRTHFVAVAAEAMRRILVDHARSKRAFKRGGGWTRLTAGPHLAVSDQPEVDIVALDEALTRLAALDPRHARIVELRFFGGLTIEETSVALGVGTTTVEEGWTFARAWLRHQLRENQPR